MIMKKRPDIDPVSVANELRPVLLKINRQLRREVHSLGVTGGQVPLLAAIKNDPGIGVRSLAEREGVSAPAMSIHVRRLVRAGLVTRTAGTDRRRVGLTVTPEAVQVLASVKSRRNVWLASRLRRLEPVQLAAVLAAIAPLERLLDEAE
jgi:DNA-binding MarR family transcriptional regulator